MTIAYAIELTNSSRAAFVGELDYRFIQLARAKGYGA